MSPGLATRQKVLPTCSLRFNKRTGDSEYICKSGRFRPADPETPAKNRPRRLPECGGDGQVAASQFRLQGRDVRDEEKREGTQNIREFSTQQTTGVSRVGNGSRALRDPRRKIGDIDQVARGRQTTALEIHAGEEITPVAVRRRLGFRQVTQGPTTTGRNKKSDQNDSANDQLS
jgi:hypothetical protein